MTDLGIPTGERLPGAPESRMGEPPLRSYQDARDIRRSYDLSQDLDAAAKAGDWDTYGQRYDQMQQDASMATMQVLADGGDPARETRPIGRFVHQDIEMARRSMIWEGRLGQLNDFKKADPELNEVRAYMSGVYEEYVANQDADLGEWMPDSMTPQAQMDYLQKLQPVTRDPNEIAEMRSKMVSVNNKMRAIDPAFNLFTDPDTSKWAHWMNREAGITGIGYVTSGEQELELGAFGRAAYIGAEAIDHAIDPILRAGYQMWEWTDQGLRGLGAPSISPPRNYLEGPDGTVYYNQERPHPGFIDTMRGAWVAATGGDVVREIASLNRLRNLERSQRKGYTALIHGISNVAGTFLGFGLPAGAAIKLGTAATSVAAKKGMVYLGALGLKGARSARAEQLVGLWAGRIGGAAGMGAFQTTAFGKEGGFRNEFLIGAAMYPALAILGHYGPRLEKVLKQRAKMPAKISQMLSEGVVMGLPFGTLEWAQMGLWDHLANPNESTLDIYLKNFFGAALFKGAFGGRARSMQEEAMLAARIHVERAEARAAFAEDLVNGKADAKVLAARFPNLDIAELQALGEIIARKKATTDPMTRRQIQEEQFALETQLDIKEFGLEPKVAAELEKIRAEEDGEPGPIEEPRTPEQRRAEAERRVQERIDPLEEPDYGDRPLIERLLIEKAADAAERKSLADAMEQGAERYQVEPDTHGTWKVTDSRTGEAAMAGLDRGAAEKWAAERYLQDVQRRGGEKYGEELVEELGILESTQQPRPTKEERAKGVRGGPGSLRKPPTLQIEAEPGAKRTTLQEIFAAFKGRLPRKGVRVPFTGIRIGGKPGDPVRPGMKKGRIQSKGTLGLFKFFQNLIRTRGGRDVVVGAHEWSHAMNRWMVSERGGKDFVDTMKQWTKDLPREARQEFERILEDYPGWEDLPAWRQAMEVWAEWHARDLLGDDTLAQLVPKLTKLFRDQLAHRDNAAIRDQFEYIKKLIYQYTIQGAKGRLRASREMAGDMASETLRATQPTLLERSRDRVLMNFFDDIITLKRAQEKWLEAARVDPADVNIMEDPARLWDALRLVAPKQTEQFVMKGITDTSGKHVPGMREIMERFKGREEDFKDYLVALVNAIRIRKRETMIETALKAGERPPKPLETTISKADYVSEIRRLQFANPDFKTGARELKAWTDQIVEWVGTAGGMPMEQIRKIQDAYVAWVPFFRIMEGGAAHARATGRSITPLREPVGRIKAGGSEPIRDPLEAMFTAMTSMIANAHRNMVVSALYKMAVGREAGGLATVVDKTMVPKNHPLKEILDAMERGVEFEGEAQFFFEDMISGLRDANALDPQSITLFAQRFIPEKNIVAYTPRLSPEEIVRTARGDKNLAEILRKQNNQELWLEIDPPVYETLMGLDAPPYHKFFDTGLLGRSLRRMSRLTRFFATGISIPFIARNIVRDVLQEPIFAGDGTFLPFAGAVRFVQGAIAYHGQRGPGSMRELYDMMGVRISSHFNEGNRRQVIGESRNLRDQFFDGAQRLESMLSTPENYLRMNRFKMVYERAKAEGAGEMEARLLALEAGKEITVNFARGGMAAKFYNQMTPYFNAGLQGQRKLWRQILFGGDGRNDAQRARIQRSAWLNAITNITMPSMVLWALNHDEEWYQDLPQWRKAGFFNFRINDDFILSLPKPFEAGILFGGLPEILLDSWVNERGQPPRLLDMVKDQLFPYLRGPGEFLPALIQPIIEGTTNYDFFRQRPLTPQWLRDNRIPQEQQTLYTTEVSKILSAAIGGKLTPIEIEHYVGGYTARFGVKGLRTIDEILGLKSHPGNVANELLLGPLFPTVHRQGYYQNEMYRIGDLLDQKAGSNVATGAELTLRARINAMKSQFSQMTRQVRGGTREAIEVERRKFEMARPLIERYRDIER
jgi:hypothetical protein